MVTEGREDPFQTQLNLLRYILRRVKMEEEKWLIATGRVCQFLPSFKGKSKQWNAKVCKHVTTELLAAACQGFFRLQQAR